MKKVKVYKIINPNHIFYEKEFIGTPIIISGENIIWNEDSIGQSYPEKDCIEIKIN